MASLTIPRLVSFCEMTKIAPSESFEMYSASETFMTGGESIKTYS